MTAVHNGLLVSLVSCTIHSLTEDESTISLKATAKARDSLAYNDSCYKPVKAPFMLVYYGNY